MPAAELADFAGFQGTVVVDALGRERQHRPHRGRVAERVEDRQDAEQHVVIGQPQNLIDRPDIRADVAMGEHHALRPACRAGGEDDRQQVVLFQLRQSEPSFQPADGRQPSHRSGGELVGPRGFVLEVLQVDDFGVELEVEAFHQAAAGQDVADAALGDAVVDKLRSHRVVQVDGHAAIDAQGGVGHQPGCGGRQEQAHVLLVGGQHLAPQQAAKNQSPHQQTRSGKFRTGGIGDLRVPHSPAAYAEELSRQDQVAGGKIAHGSTKPY